MDEVSIRQSSDPDSSAVDSASEQASPETILLKDYRPRSIYIIPVTEVPRATFPIIDMHSHPYAKTAKEIDEWVRNMDEVGVAKTIIPEPQGRSSSISIGSMLFIPIASNSGAALITRVMTNQNSASEQSRYWRSAIRLAHVELANYMTREKALIRTT